MWLDLQANDAEMFVDSRLAAPLQQEEPNKINAIDSLFLMRC